MNSVPQGTYWHVGEGEWRFQLSFCNSQAKIIDNFKEWSLAGEGRDAKENKNIMIFSKKFKNHSDLEVFILDLKQTDEISIEEA